MTPQRKKTFSCIWERGSKRRASPLIKSTKCSTGKPAADGVAGRMNPGIRHERRGEVAKDVHAIAVGFTPPRRRRNQRHDGDKQSPVKSARQRWNQQEPAQLLILFYPPHFALFLFMKGGRARAVDAPVLVDVVVVFLGVLNLRHVCLGP